MDFSFGLEWTSVSVLVDRCLNEGTEAGKVDECIGAELLGWYLLVRIAGVEGRVEGSETC
jgi:hypothetical protein